MRAEYASLLRPEQVAMGCEIRHRQIQSGRRGLRDYDELQDGGVFSEDKSGNKMNQSALCSRSALQRPPTRMILS